MGLIELFKGFHSRAVEQEFPPSARVLYLTLLGEFNAAYWKDELAFTESELSGLTGLRKTTVHEAKEFLASRHFIKTWKKKRVTIFKLLGDQVPTSERPSSDRQPTDERPKSDQTPTDAHLLTRAKDVKDVSNIQDIKTEITDTATAHARGFLSVNSAEVQNAWRQCAGENLTGGAAYGLIELENVYGTQAVVDAIFEADRANTRERISFNFVKKVLENMVSGKEAKPNARRTTRNSVRYQFGADEAPEC